LSKEWILAGDAQLNQSEVGAAPHSRARDLQAASRPDSPRPAAGSSPRSRRFESVPGADAAAVMSLVHSARINGRDPYASLKDILERLPTHPASRIDELLPHRWQG